MRGLSRKKADMEDVPNIVHERLSTTSAGGHPDADVLTAFAERCLPERERALVLDHLARCGDCRDVLALALPAIEPVETATRPSPARWLAWPALRWGLAVAGVVVVASFGMLRYERSSRLTGASQASSQTTMVAKESSPQAPSLQPSAAEARPEPKGENLGLPRSSAGAKASGGQDGPMGVGGSELPSRPAEGELAARALPRASNAIHQNGGAGGGAASSTTDGFQMSMRSQQQQQQNLAGTQASSRQPPVAADKHAITVAATPSGTSAAEGSTGAASQIGAATAELQAPGVSQPAEQASNEDVSSLSKAKPAMVQSEPLSSAPRWTISATGGLQRSFDQGRTWQDVAINAVPRASSSMSFGGPMRPPSTAASPAEPVPAGQPAPAPVFRALAANGVEVWAGGSAGALYHSVDGGDHWNHVVPTSAGTVLVSDIVGLEFPDVQHGKITTSAAEVWTTSDDGRTWEKQ
jgi:hypothetical protein